MKNVIGRDNFISPSCYSAPCLWNAVSENNDSICPITEWQIEKNAKDKDDTKRLTKVAR